LQKLYQFLSLHQTTHETTQHVDKISNHGHYG
jgi:hypothetical protein